MKVKPIPKRKELRLKGYDYSLAGGYFVAITAQRRGEVFGYLENEEVVLNPIGRMVEECWVKTRDRFYPFKLDEFILMPDHFHAILFITESNLGAGLAPALEDIDQAIDKGRATTRVAPTLGRIIGAFKSISTNQYYSGVKSLGWPIYEKKLWQRGFYDRIIRNETELNLIREYVLNNAVNRQPFENYLD